VPAPFSSSYHQRRCGFRRAASPATRSPRWRSGR
jgi:hypothetical protein